MPNRPFRFLHASDFHLEQPLMGVADVPDHLRDLFLDSPYMAARRVFDKAIEEDAAFLILSGDILHPMDGGPRAMLFLIEQFARLAEREIPVYWAGGNVDSPEAWPSALPFPNNVHRFPRESVEEVVYEQEGVPLVRLVGISRDRQQMFRPKEFSADPGGLYTVAVTHGGGDPAVLQARGLHYWALGGRHDRNTPQSGPRSVHYCGSPQGRSPKETGVHGCTLVQVDEQQQSRISLIPTDAVRWVTEQVLIDDTATRESLETLFRERLHTLSESAGNLPLLISWKFAGKGALASQLRRGNLASQLLDWLRTEFGHAQPALWSLSLDIELTDPVPLDWYEQETIRGDFLRAVRKLQMNTDESLELEHYVAESHQAGTLAESVVNPDEAARNLVLREAALLGVDLLSGEETPS